MKESKKDGSAPQPRVFVPSESGDSSVVQLRYIQMAAQSDYPKEETRYRAGAATCISDNRTMKQKST